MKHRIKNLLLILIGSFIFSTSVNVFFAPSEMITGGVSGLSIIIEHVSAQYLPFTIPLWFSNILLNIPLFIIALRVLGKKSLTKTFIATFVCTIALFLTKNITPYHAEQGDMFLVSLYGGLLNGLGIGLVLSSGATTGGTDLMASIVHEKYKHFDVNQIIMLFDFIIIMCGFFMFGARIAMYAIASVFVSTKVIGTILEGFHFAKAVYIISDHNDQITQFLMHEVGRGVTALKGIGMYTGKDRNILLCVIEQKQIIELKEFVRDIDPKAFVMVSDVREVLGEGFKSI